MKKLILISLLFTSCSFLAQEFHQDRTVEYSIDLTKLKTEDQALSISKELKVLEGVKFCNLDALNYKLYVSVFESKESKHPIGMDEIKVVLANNKVEITNHTLKIKQD